MGKMAVPTRAERHAAIKTMENVAATMAALVVTQRGARGGARVRRGRAAAAAAVPTAGPPPLLALQSLPCLHAPGLLLLLIAPSLSLPRLLTATTRVLPNARVLLKGSLLVKTKH